MALKVVFENGKRESQITTSEEETQLQGFLGLKKWEIIRNVIQMGFMEENAKPWKYIPLVE